VYRRIAVFKGVQRCFTHHPTIGHYSYFPEPEALPHSLDDWHKGSDVSRVAWPHLTANRATLNIHCHADHHLFEIGSVILIVTAFADLSTLAFKVERSGVGKEISPALEERFLEEVFGAANRSGRLLKLFDGVSQKCHRPIKMMQPKTLSSRAKIILSPALSRSIAAT
jgi:hypothetical protein